MRLLERGADPTMADSQNATPLYGAVNTQWIPKARHPQPADYLQQETSHLELMQALLDAGADVNARIDSSLWYTVYNVDQLGVDRSGATAFLARRLFAGHPGDEAAGGERRGPAHPDGQGAGAAASPHAHRRG